MSEKGKKEEEKEQHRVTARIGCGRKGCGDNGLFSSLCKNCYMADHYVPGDRVR